MITRVETIAIYISDQQRSLDFYTKKVGFEVRKDIPFGPPDAGLRWIEVAPRGAETVLALFTPPGYEDRIGSIDGLVFMCDDIHATATGMKERGVEFLREPVQIPSGWWAQFQDPDGNSFGLSQSS